MPTFDTILDYLWELGLRCTGSPHSRHRQLAALRRLDPHLLRDIGLTSEEANLATTRRRATPKPEPRSTASIDLGRPYPNR